MRSRFFRAVGLLGAVAAFWLTTSSASAQCTSLTVVATAGSTTPDWVKAPSDELSTTPLSASVTSPPSGGSAPCTISGPTWSWSVGDPGAGCSAWIDHPDPSSATATLYCSFMDGGYWTVPCTATVGYSDGCGHCWSGTSSCNGDPKSVILVDLQVTSGATAASGSDTTNYGAVKGTGTVLLTATTKPNTEDAAANITWSGGDAVTGVSSQRTVSKATSAKTTVTATIATVTKTKVIWILWVTIENKITGTTPANAVQFGTSYDGTENLGAVAYSANSTARGKIVPIGTIGPAGAGAVFTTGWTFNRDRWCHDFKDGAQDTYFDAAWTDDTSDASFQKLTPDAGDKIYDRDAPNCAQFGATTKWQTYNNFREFVKWNGTLASDYQGWYWKAIWQGGATPGITLKEIGQGSITLPATAP